MIANLENNIPKKFEPFEQLEEFFGGKKFVLGNEVTKDEVQKDKRLEELFVYLNLYV